MTKKIFDRKVNTVEKKAAAKKKKTPKVKTAATMFEEAKQDIEKKFRSNIEQAALKALGFDNRWGDKWEVDHCNCRVSELTDWIKERARDIIKHLDLEKEMKLTEKEKKQLRKTCRENLYEEVERSVYHYDGPIVQYAQKVLKEELEAILKEKDFRAKIRAKLKQITGVMLKDL